MLYLMCVGIGVTVVYLFSYSEYCNAHDKPISPDHPINIERTSQMLLLDSAKQLLRDSRFEKSNRTIKATFRVQGFHLPYATISANTSMASVCNQRFTIYFGTNAKPWTNYD